ncbi:hypothetical protein DCS_04595 [Drechmeria coniospora]|uniref:SWR1-complex protein 3 domain-containing protein n=1 Tax=Drechmeria coniospora TaxID=98403 RepID=A0A151GKF3_DRECN|nr:hypothetical protein DCS_04595 [Drechmeria coniospora]KYK57584.1 hypothetical protein DCS_04595 [Drechmeria coniospora]
MELAAKRRTSLREQSSTPAPPPEPVREPTPEPSLPPPLPTSIQVGKPLPTVEDPQPGSLSSKEFHGVLAESLSRSRHRWINEGLFEKYWTKPYKRKGVLHEDPKNPPKDSMMKVGAVTITIEPHIVEATMYAVKTSKLPERQTPAAGKQQQQPTPTASKQQQTPGTKKQHPQLQAKKQPAKVRPVLQYGPPNGYMPPPPSTPTPITPMPMIAAKSPVFVPSPSLTTRQLQPSPSPAPPPAPAPQIPHQPVSGTELVHSAPAMHNAAPSANPGMTPRASPASSSLPRAAPPLAAANQPLPNPPQIQVATPPPSSTPPVHATDRPPGPVGAAPSPSVAKPAAPVAKPAVNDPVIALLAQKASGDPALRDLMKRVAVGQAREGELAQFQRIIDQLNAEYKQKGGQQGPSADRLLVDGRTVKYFADEVRTILDIVLASNPHQKSSELRPPPRSDPLVVLVVKTALEDQRTKDMIRRVADGRPGPTDAQDLKDILDRLHRDAKIVPKASIPPAQARPQVPNGLPNGQVKAAGAPAMAQPTPQPLRSKAAPPVSRPDISAVIFDFGTGDRYLFPKYSVLEFLPTQTGQQVVASFLIVRKGSTSDYGGDPALDYYQPVTIRLQSNSGRHLENLARVVAPQDEVRWYMDDIMDNMTRAEYVLLAMRLPRSEQGGGDQPPSAGEESKNDTPTPKPESESERSQSGKLGVLWSTTSIRKAPQPTDMMKFLDPEQESQSQYERLIQAVVEKQAEAI